LAILPDEPRNGNDQTATLLLHTELESRFGSCQDQKASKEKWGDE